METIIFNSFLSHFSAINAIVFSDSKKISKKEYNIIYSFVEEYSEKQRELSDLFIQESKNPELNKLRSLIHNFCELYPIQKKCLNDRILTLQRELLERCHFEAEPNEALKEADEKLKIEQQKMRMFHNTIDDFNKAKVKYLEESKKHSEAHNEVFMAMQNCCTTIADKLHEICKFTNEILEPDSSFNEFIGTEISNKIFEYVCRSKNKVLECRNAEVFYCMLNLFLKHILYKNIAVVKSEQIIRALIDYLALKIAPEHKDYWINRISSLLGITYDKSHHDKSYYDNLMKL
ncbi:MAG: hypothetical protein J6W13_06855 [Salinivirgaceae bacterium]|nr:hypothetical protein [Salinivirgaceae bacterium]